MSSIYTQLISNVLFPIHEKLKHHSSVQWRKNLEKTQWCSGEELRELQSRNLVNFFKRINSEVPYYRKLFKDSQLVPEELNSVLALQRLPFLTKKLIRENTESIKAHNSKKLVRYNTGGSSGEPLVFYMGMDRVSHDVAAKWRATRWWQVDIGDPEIVVWGSPIELGAQDKMRGIRDKILRSRLVPAFEMSESKLDEYISRIVDTRPAMIFGYPSSIALIAQHAQRRNIVLSNLGARVVFVTSERLYDYQREIIEKTFSCPVANGYGGRDAGFIAHQCPDGGMHISAEDIIVEIVDQDGKVLPPGQSGEVVVTHMATWEFPFVRYRTGDVATIDPNPCACGRGLPLLKEIHGRTTDFIVAADGTVMHGLALIYVLRDLPGIELFKIVQETKTLLKVFVVPSQAYSPSIRETIINSLKQRLGQATQIDIELVEDIPREKNGKYRYVQSKVTVG